MKTIWKFRIEPEGVQFVEMPYRAKPLKVDWDPYEKRAYLWAECESTEPTRKYLVNVVGTGRSLDRVQGRYIGTFTYPSRVASMMLQWHVYINPEPAVS